MTDESLGPCVWKFHLQITRPWEEDRATMTRIGKLALLGILMCAGAWAQAGTSVKVGTSPEGARYYIDGREYNTNQIFFWTLGSTHVVQFPYSVDPNTNETLPFQYSDNATKRYTFNSWNTNGPDLIPRNAAVQVVTATTAVTELIAALTVEYKVRIQFYGTPQTEETLTCGAPGNNIPQDGYRYGVVYVDNVCIMTTKESWLREGKHIMNAFPLPGFVFTGWMVDGGQVDPSYLSSYNVTHSVTIIPLFMPAKRVRFSSNPPGLKIVVDRTTIILPPGLPKNQLPQTNIDSACTPDYTRLPVGTPAGVVPLCTGDFDFLPGSSHQLGAPESQKDDAGNWWVFAGFSNGLKQNSTYVADQNVGTADYIIANFVPGIPVTLLTSPPNLKLNIDGRENWQGYNFIWGAGEKHTVTAPATQTDSRTRKYQFLSWSNKGEATQEITVPSDRFGMTMTANFQILGQLKIITAPALLSVHVDGTECVVPCTVDRLPGSQVQLRVPRTVPDGKAARYDFGGWSNNETNDTTTVTFDSNVQNLQASYFSSYLVAATSDPAGAVTFNFSPGSSDGFFAQGTRLTVQATPKGGYRFRRWDGDLSGTFSTGYLTVNGPHSVIARMDRVPFIPPAGIKNAAGDTPDGTVAPGSIIAIYGENLASGLEIGRVNPLAQTLANVTVQVADRLLPLLFVSPNQINAQVPSDLGDGTYTLKVRNQGQPDVTGNFNVRRNSPGLFTTRDEQGAPLALALHEDGSPVTRESPARKRETISLYGTGFGPYDRQVIDGFIVPDKSLYKLLDQVSVVSGDLTYSPEWAGAAAGMVGTAVMKLKIAEEMPAAALLDVTVSVNGALSNTVRLPIE